MRHVLAVLATCSAVSCGGKSASRPAPVKPAVDAPDPTGPHKAAIAAQVQPLIDAEIASGVVVGVYDAGTVEIYGFGAGPGGAPPSGRTLFELGSVTKVYTGLLLADAIQRNEVTLDTPTAELLPPGVTMPTADGATITLRHLVLHSSGLPRMPPSLVPRATAPDPYAGYSEDALYRDLVATRLESRPGTRIEYSNYGVGLLGFVLGRKIGSDYKQAIKSRVLEPLGLADTYFTVPPTATARRAQGTNEELVRVPPWTWDALAGAGALISTARDQLKLVEAQLEAAAGGTAPLRRAMAFSQEAQLEGTTPNTGLGWQIDRDGRFWHNGGTGGFHAFIGFEPKTRRGLVILSSTSTSYVDQLARRIYKVLAGETVPPPKTPSADQLKEYAGSYDFSGQQLKIIAEGKRIYVEGPGEPRIRMIPFSDREFFIEALQAFVAFERDGGDKITRMVFVVAGNQISLPRTGD